MSRLKETQTRTLTMNLEEKKCPSISVSRGSDGRWKKSQTYRSGDVIEIRVGQEFERWDHDMCPDRQTVYLMATLLYLLNKQQTVWNYMISARCETVTLMSANFTSTAIKPPLKDYGLSIISRNSSLRFAVSKKSKNFDRGHPVVYVLTILYIKRSSNTNQFLYIIHIR